MTHHKTKALIPNQKNFIYLFLLAIVVNLISGCNFPSRQSSDHQFKIYQESDLATAPISIEFSLSLPQVLGKGERIELEIIDEVTGLPYNIKRYDMEKVNDLEYNVQLLVPASSVIKYRYAKYDGATYQSEHNSVDSPVRYRLFYANTPGKSHDILYSWGDTASQAGTGRLEGYVLDKATQSPIPDILVSAGGKLVFSDANGRFLIDGLADGQQNVVFYAPDGGYQTYQQGAIITAGQITPAALELIPLQPVTVTFQVNLPQDAIGAPVYMAGNLLQLGNTFSDLTGSMTINPKLMPQLTPQGDGSLSIDLNLYPGSDLRYKFTLGDGFWNAEQDPSGGFRVRQLVVPDHNVTLSISIASWRTTGFEPITFQITIPPEFSPKDEKFIQFKIKSWTEPIPLWPTGNGNYLYILFSPFSKDDLISYRFCRNADCLYGLNGEMQSSLIQIQPKNEPQTVDIEIKNWDRWQVSDPTLDYTPSPAPYSSGSYATMIELTSEMDTYWQAYAPSIFENLSALGANTVIISPQWMASLDSPLLYPEIGRTLFSQQLLYVLGQAQGFGLKTGIYPQFVFNNPDLFWSQKPKTVLWWEEWFESYHNFIINYAKLAELSGVDYLLIGGKDILPAFSGGNYPGGNETTLSYDSEPLWQDIILDLRKTFTGDLIWVTNVHTTADPLPEFIPTFDGIYIIVDSPLTTAKEPTFDEIAYGFTNVIDQNIYEIYRSTGLPVYLGLGYPSANQAASGCLLINDQCNNDGLFLHNEIEAAETNLDIQMLIYEAVLPVIASRPWIAGTSIRGYNPTLISHDQISSIAGKPAEALISDWFSRINSQ